jgi:hypothetical protein
LCSPHQRDDWQVRGSRLWRAGAENLPPRRLYEKLGLVDLRSSAEPCRAASYSTMFWLLDR